MIVKLTHYEICNAQSVGNRRNDECIRMGVSGRGQINITDAARTDQQAAGAEEATAKGINHYWPGSVNTFHTEPDIPPDIEVRYTPRPDGRLIVRPDENPRPHWRYVLARGEMPDYEIVGWCWGWEAMQDKWLDNPNGRGEAWFVPDWALRPMSTIDDPDDNAQPGDSAYSHHNGAPTLFN